MYCKNPLGMPLKICELPFEDTNLVFTIILPDPNTITALESQLNAPLFDQLLSQMQPTAINSTLPVFSIQHRVDFRQTLKELGVSDLCEFDLRQDGLFISHAYFETSITVRNETVLAKHTNLFLMTRKEAEINNQPDNIDFRDCENPFLFFIRDAKTNLILFMGKLASPIN